MHLLFIAYGYREDERAALYGAKTVRSLLDIGIGVKDENMRALVACLERDRDVLCGQTLAVKDHGLCKARNSYAEFDVCLCLHGVFEDILEGIICLKLYVDLVGVKHGGDGKRVYYLALAVHKCRERELGPALVHISGAAAVVRLKSEEVSFTVIGSEE